MNTLSPPGSPEPMHDTRPRTVSALSYNSNRSRRSNSSSNKLDLLETSKEKRRLNTKADPSKALVEAQPAAVALEESSLDNLRHISHRDFDGNVITDPDRSNPTRHRLERPLDTIRSFQAAAEGTSNRRASYYSRSSSQVGDNSTPNRRSGYWSSPASNVSTQQRTRPSGGGYYRNSSYGLPTQSTVEEAPGSSQQYGRKQMNSPYYQGLNDSPMSQHSHQPSYETMTSGSDENSKSTNPSSQNSSFDQLQQFRKPEEYGYNNVYGNEANYNHQPVQRPYQVYGQQSSYIPPPPPKDGSYGNNPHLPIRLNGANSGPPPTMAEVQQASPVKRQSWLRRKFSRHGS